MVVYKVMGHGLNRLLGLSKGNLSVASQRPFTISLATKPPLPSVISTLCIVVLKGILVEVDYHKQIHYLALKLPLTTNSNVISSSKAFPTNMGTSILEITVPPILIPRGCKIYRFSPSS
ncbi:hypothetical protein CY35_11G046900 [Sphagnum magellanicum]|nr:hypothetical protein CY35_11G046900 [Sphagnum magellanicum]